MFSSVERRTISASRCAIWRSEGEQAAQYLSHKTVVIVQDFADYYGIEVYFSRSESQLQNWGQAIEEIAKG